MISNNMVIVSNSKLAGSRITNFYLPEREFTFSVNVGIAAHQNDPDEIERLAVEIAKEVLHEANDEADCKILIPEY